MQDIETESLSVTIKVLKVDSKKMTLSVFKQLQERQIIDDDLELKGSVWGKVNYQLPKQPTNETNIVWQDGNDLFRWAVKPLRMSPEQAKRNQDNYEINLYELLAHPSLVTAVKNTPEEEVQSLSMLFGKYRTLYHQLVNADHLFIAV